MVKNTELEDLTRDQLIRLAEVRGLKLPDGYVAKQKLVRLLREQHQQRKAGGGR
jgi:hypothetical protein